MHFDGQTTPFRPNRTDYGVYRTHVLETWFQLEAKLVSLMVEGTLTFPI